jgi:hypothetical protein
MKFGYNYYEVVVSYDEDQKLSVWWRLDPSFIGSTLSFFRLKEGQDKPEQTTEYQSFVHYSNERLGWRQITMIIQSDYNFESSDMLAEAKKIIANERAKTVSYFDFLCLRKEFDLLKEQVQSRLK